MRGSLGPLQDGGRVAIIGGGPGGAACALMLQREAQALDRRIQVTLVEGKQFEGERHYNQCVGVCSPPIEEIFTQELGQPFPCHLQRAAISGYVLHTPRQQIVLDGDHDPSIALRRVQFDAYMLEAARQHGTAVLAARATDLEFHDDRVVVYTENAVLEVDVVVGAFGLDEGTAAVFSRAAGYRPPPTLASVVTKYHPGEQAMLDFGTRIHAFLPAIPGIEFGGITPKGNHLTLNIAGAQANADQMDAFLGIPQVRQALPCLEDAGNFDPKDLEYFKGRFPRGLARRFCGDRYVLVGDASGLVRAFKGKGITSAVQTGIRAARAILYTGISAAAFKSYLSANRDIADDIPYGQFMRRFTILAARSGLMDRVLLAAQGDAGLRHALFAAVSGHETYRRVLGESLSFASMRSVSRAMLQPGERSGDAFIGK